MHILCIRPYKQEDEQYCKELAKNCIMDLLNRIYSNNMIARSTFHIFLALFACKLYWLGTPFPYYLIYPFIIICGIYITLHLLFWKIIRDYQRDLFDIARNYNANGDKFFWVAEVYLYRSLKNFPYLHYIWLTEKKLQKSNINVYDYNKKIVGFIGVDKNIRIGNCALLNKFLVHNDYTRKGIGTHLIKTVFQFCDEKKYTRVNLQLFDFLTNAINLCKKLGFKYYETQSKSLLPLLGKVKIHEFSYLMKFTNPTHSIKTKTQIQTEMLTKSKTQKQIQKKRYLRHLNF